MIGTALSRLPHRPVAKRRHPLSVRVNSSMTQYGGRLGGVGPLTSSTICHNLKQFRVEIKIFVVGDGDFPFAEFLNL